MPGPLLPLAGLKAAMPKGYDYQSTDPSYDPATDPSAPPDKWSIPPDEDTLTKGILGTRDALQGLAGVGNDSSANRFGQMAGAALPLMGSSGIPGLYSRLEQAVGKLPASIKASSALNMLRKFAHPEEIAATGVEGMLQGLGDAKVRQMDVAHQAVNNPIKLNVENLGQLEDNPMGPDGYFKYGTAGYLKNPTTWDKYQMPGSIPGSYRETLIKTPVPPSQEAYENSGPHSRMEDLIHLTTNPDISESYLDLHYPMHPNVLASIRHNERVLPLTNLPDGFKVQTGSDFAHEGPVSWVEGRQPDPTNTIRGWNHYMGPSDPTEAGAIARAKQELGTKGRVLENVQSSWHQQGAAHGYAGLPEDPALHERFRQTREQRDITYAKYKEELDRVRDHEGLPTAAEDSINLAFDNPQITAAYEAYEDATRNYVDASNALNDPMQTPDAPFKDNRWADLALKQQVMDVAGRPDLEWLGITPGSESMKRGELLNPQFHDQTLPTKLGKILAPFGGKMEEVPTGLKGESPIMRNYFNSTAGTHQIYDPANQDPIDLELGGKHLASVWPKTGQIHDPLMTSGRTGHHRANELQNIIEDQYTPDVKMWLARMPPSMKDAILKKGLPLLTLVGMMKASQGLRDAAPRGPQ